MKTRENQAGFTLTELLVVIAIVAMLAALTTVAATKGYDFAKQAAIATEGNTVGEAMTQFKAKYGAYPPCDLSNPTSNTALLAFIMQAFPRYNTANLVNDWTLLGIDTTTYHPDRALVFWLSGFSPDVTSPFTGAGARTPLFTFDTTRLYNVNHSSPGFGTAGYSQPTFPVGATPSNTTLQENQKIGNFGYVPSSGSGTPYVYFDAASGYGTITVSTPSFTFSKPYAAINASGSSVGTAVPYVQDVTNATIPSASPAPGVTYQFCNPTTCQIISAGQDGLFGTPSGSGYTNLRMYPTGYGYDTTGADVDNTSNFCSKSRLGDALP